MMGEIERVLPLDVDDLGGYMADKDLSPDECAVVFEYMSRNLSTTSRHIAADKIMCAILRKYGYGKAADVFEEMDKWYA